MFFAPTAGTYTVSIATIEDDLEKIPLKYLANYNIVNGEATGSTQSLLGNASGFYAVAENASIASGDFSHSEGQGTVASGQDSHAEGYNTTASSQHQHVQGKYNLEDTSNTYAHIVGNGTDSSARSNAHTIDWDGNAWFAGNVYVGGAGQNDEPAEKLAKVSDIPIVPVNDKYVIDFGLPVKIDTSDFDVFNRILASGTATYGTVAVNEDGKSFVYTPTAILQDIDNVELIFSDDSTTTVQIIPATTMYYEEDFITFSDSSTATENIGVWSQVGTKTADVYQKTSRPKPLSDYCVNDVYGYDDAYAEFTEYSLGSTMKVTVDAATGKPSTAPQASFRFVGTGFDIISLTNNDSGVIVLSVKEVGDPDGDGTENERVSYAMADTFYGYNYYEYYCTTYTLNADSGEWSSTSVELGLDAYTTATYGLTANDNGTFTVTDSESQYRVYGTKLWLVDPTSTDTLWQVPVLKVDSLPYGTYDVTLQAAYMGSAFDHAGDGSYTIWLDGIRIYNTAQRNDIAENVYKKNNEYGASFVNIYDLSKTSWKDTSGTQTSVVKLKFDNSSYNLMNSTNTPSGHFVAIEPGMIRAFQIAKTGNNPRVQLGIQLYHLVSGNNAILSVIDSFDAASNSAHSNAITISTATEMFYEVSIVEYGENSYVVVKNTGKDNILAINSAKLFDCEIVTHADQAAVDAFVSDIIAIANGTMQVQANWDQTDPSAPSFIVNKPEIATDEEIIEMLMEIDMIPVVVDSDGSALADENNNVLLW